MAEALAEFFPWLDARKRAAAAAVSDAIANPADTLWAALKGMGQNLGVVPTPEQAERTENLKSIMFSMSPEGEAAKKAQVAEAMMGFGSGGIGSGALAGMLRPKGNPALMLSHGMSSLEAPHGGTIKELMHPSLAITTQEGNANPFGSGKYNSLLIPKIGAFDPAFDTSTLFNRDAYVARRSDYPGGSFPTGQERMMSRELSPPPGSEGRTGWWTSDAEYNAGKGPGSHNAAIQASPAFRSLAEFEQSRKGAGTLGKGYTYDDVAAWSKTFTSDFIDWAKDRKLPTTGNWLDTLRAAAANDDQRAIQLLRSAQTAPSEYAELKMSGPVPLIGNRFAGAILAPGHEAHSEALMARGIPSVQKTPDLTAQGIFQIADAMQRMAGPVKERSLRVRAGWEPGQDVPPRQVRIEGSPERANLQPWQEKAQSMTDSGDWLAGPLEGPDMMQPHSPEVEKTLIEKASMDPLSGKPWDVNQLPKIKNKLVDAFLKEVDNKLSFQHTEIDGTMYELDHTNGLVHFWDDTAGNWIPAGKINLNKVMGMEEAGGVETWHPLNPSAVATAKLKFKAGKIAGDPSPAQFQDVFGDWFTVDNAGNIFAINKSGLNKLVGTVHQ